MAADRNLWQTPQATARLTPTAPNPPGVAGLVWIPVFTATRLMTDTPIWEDATSYRQGERGTRPPNAYSVKSGPLRLSICSAHIYDPDHWVVNCHPLGVDMHRLGTNDMPLADAKAAAIAYVAKKLHSYSEALGRISHD
jgi:hypothetical protein